MIEKSRIKFTVSEETGEIIGFVSRPPKGKGSSKLKGVCEDSRYRKKICVLSAKLKGHILPDKLYDVELRPMFKQNGYIVESAVQALFEADIETIVGPKSIYQIKIEFGYKKIYFDPIDGKTASSRTIDGVVKVLDKRDDLENKAEVISRFIKYAQELLRLMKADGYYVTG